MKILRMDRAKGKTTKLVAECIKNNGIYIVCSYTRKKWLVDKYPLLDEQRIFVKPEELLGTEFDDCPIYIDDVDEYLNRMFSHHNCWVEKVSLTTDKGNRRLKERQKALKSNPKKAVLSIELDENFLKEFGHLF